MADFDARQRRIMDHVRRTTDINLQRMRSDQNARKQRIFEHLRRSTP
ncbi:MAG: hypothetical protein NZ482_06620 [Gloeomargarita sp. SKYG98]|nr:hypothetical protein [Gloeomargarita sp. SKYG98]